MVPHGNENINKSKKALLVASCRRGHNSVIELTKMIHFNEDYPEFQNIYIPSLKDSHVMVYNGNWEAKKKNEVVNELYDSKTDYIKNNKNIFYNSLTEPEKNSFNRWIETDTKKHTSPKDQKIINSTIGKLMDLLYNERKIVIDTKKSMNNIENENITIQQNNI
jgi:hypothetical protein